MRTLWVDDIRNPPPGFVCDIARNYFAAIQQLEQNEYVVVDLDQNLGSFEPEGTEKTGLDVLKYIVKMKKVGRKGPGEYHSLTADPIGGAWMKALIDQHLK